ncbi:MAG: DinB family protein [Bryobacteraceae bacterium]
MKSFYQVLVLSALATAAFAQGPAPADNPMSTWLRDAYMRNRANITRTAEKMPEEFYDMRPGAQPEVRSFGQQVGHVANFNFLWCSQAKGEKNPNTTNLEKLGTKAEFVKALNDAFAYCDPVYSGLTDASGAQVIEITQESGRQTKNLRMGLLTLNYAHNNEIYGSMVVYLRMKNLVPPASEPRTGQRRQ